MRICSGKTPLCRSRQQSGFTLVELMVALVVAAVLMAIAIPSYQRITTSTQLSTAANSLVNALNAARMVAIKRNQDAQFCAGSAAKDGATTLGKACYTPAGQPGAVYTLVKNSSGVVQADQVQAAIQGTSSILIITISQGLVFKPQGLAYKTVGAAGAGPYTGAVATICTDKISSDNVRTINMVTGGNMNTTTATISGGC